MSLLKPAENTTAFTKWGILGFAGSGKSRTATEIAIGLSLRSKKAPVAYIDTESGVDYLKPLYDKAGVPLLVAKTRAFKDACDIFVEAVTMGCSCIILDSVTHIWLEIIESYIKQFGRKGGLAIKDWGRLKQEWRKLTDAYLNSKIHAILCGRAKWEYEMEVNEETEKKELVKAGTAMSTEKDMGYEPSILLEMERVKVHDSKGARIENWSTILKDRSGVMNGARILYPKFMDFLPLVDAVNLGGEHLAVDTTRTSDALFPRDDYSERKRLVEIELEELQAVLIKAGLDGQSAESKSRRVALLEQAFGTASKTKIETMRLEQLKAGRKALEGTLGVHAPVVLTHETSGLPPSHPVTEPVAATVVQWAPPPEKDATKPAPARRRGRPRKEAAPPVGEPKDVGSFAEPAKPAACPADTVAEGVATVSDPDEPDDAERRARLRLHDNIRVLMDNRKMPSFALNKILEQADPANKWTFDGMLALQVPSWVLERTQELLVL